MKKKLTRISVLPTLLLALTTGSLVPSVQAGSIGTTYGGYVSGTTTGKFPANVALNDNVSTASVFGYLPSDAAPPVGGKYVFKSTSAAESLGVTVNYPTPNTFGTNSWSDNYVPSSSASFYILMSKSGSTVTMDIHSTTNGGTSGTTKTGAFVDIFLTSTVYTSTALPTTQAQLNEFLLTSGKLQWDPQGPEFDAVLNFFGQTGGVPEPSSFILMSVAMATCGGVLAIRRRKRIRAS